ncbi:hypothetical protein PDL03_19185 [Bacillus cereus]|uniref:hypothetical protein n=1 Tax=Bacillus sp. G3(2015) TaxID=1706731 RepID=UPI0007389CCA|nr:hypothetical protein [Bacillus sp. G3(2015)]KUF34485.1 hypothetical protein AMR94_02500 [Bacillus sp. G3(2015)]MDA1951651.1 hypothetical protein [Bacillus cereus]HDX9713158.1 hypothetical protein [Bacillus cereus]
MMKNAYEELYGSKGIDTNYEREKIEYRPSIGYTKEMAIQNLQPQVKGIIERSRKFTVSQSLLDYDELINEVNVILKDIKERNDNQLIDKLTENLKQRRVKEAALLEKEYCGYKQKGDLELYSLLFNIKESITSQREFIDSRFRVQFTNESDLEKIEKAELKSIEEWEFLEAQVLEGYSILAEAHEDDEEPIMDENLFPNIRELNYEVLTKMEQIKRKQEMFHITLADTSYIHKNRYFMILNVIEKAKILVYDSKSLIDKNLKAFILSIKEFGDLSIVKSHLVLNFNDIQDQHLSIKGRMISLDVEKEIFASEKHYLHQQLEVKTTEPLKNWLFNQEEQMSGSMDLFATYMINSIDNVKKTYESNIADILNFYKSESDFYEKQTNLLRNKEEIRRFYRILEDLEGVQEIQGPWIEEYLRAEGYSI